MVDDDVGDLQPAARAQDAIDLVEDDVLVGQEVDDAVGDDDVDRRVLDRQRLDERLVELDALRAPSRGRSPARASSMAVVMSTPIARPAGPVICAAMSRSVPAPHPRSSTTDPGSIRPSSQWLATPAKLSTVASGTRASSGSG